MSRPTDDRPPSPSAPGPTRSRRACGRHRRTTARTPTARRSSSATWARPAGPWTPSPTVRTSRSGAARRRRRRAACGSPSPSAPRAAGRSGARRARWRRARRWPSRRGRGARGTAARARRTGRSDAGPGPHQDPRAAAVAVLPLHREGVRRARQRLLWVGGRRVEAEGLSDVDATGRVRRHPGHRRRSVLAGRRVRRGVGGRGRRRGELVGAGAAVGPRGERSARAGARRGRRGDGDPRAWMNVSVYGVTWSVELTVTVAPVGELANERATVLGLSCTVRESVRPPLSVTVTVSRRCEGYSWSGAWKLPDETPGKVLRLCVWHTSRGSAGWPGPTRTPRRAGALRGRWPSPRS